uniref:GDNF family receptor alpha 3 n=1 Tax=Varanus komodoensis TaxID=61221 RepID=A0A8D2LK79_VARKO
MSLLLRHCPIQFTKFCEECVLDAFILTLITLPCFPTASVFPLTTEIPNNCITAENLCVADPACNAAYQTLQNCSPSLAKSNSFLLHHEARNRCQEAETMIRNSYFGECKCHRRSRKQKRCLHIYWTVHSTLAQDSANPCLQATNICHLDHRCLRLRSRYAKICSAGHPCDQRKCHQGLRLFFERVDLDFTKRLLFCPCQDEVCGERRWNTIVPECSFQSGSKPNCLVLLDAHCSVSSQHGFVRTLCTHIPDFAFLELDTGTPMTPNYVSNSSAEVTLWCTCKNSGNREEDCERILSAFASNRCLSECRGPPRSICHCAWADGNCSSKPLEGWRNLFPCGFPWPCTLFASLCCTFCHCMGKNPA